LGIWAFGAMKTSAMDLEMERNDVKRERARGHRARHRPKKPKKSMCARGFSDADVLSISIVRRSR
jgi:hypothetical protein